MTQNDESAASWYQLAANNGGVLAMFELALYYQDGIGVPKNRAPPICSRRPPRAAISQPSTIWLCCMWKASMPRPA
ncbi:hypothetical protein N8D56_08515 [Devosia sp. A8/3-2]|nr:hypothetical protein N8D56_08515 [Devosia sp. A8/3-2]